MTEEKSWLGEWTFEVESIGEIKLLGTLSYSPKDKFILEASIRHASSIKDFLFLNRISRVKYIIGLDYKTQKNITLIDCQLSNVNISFNGGSFFRITPTFLIEGLGYDNTKKPLLFQSLIIKYSGLNQWLNSLYQSKINTIGKNKISITYKRSKSIHCSINSLLNLSIHFDFSTKHDNSDDTGLFIIDNVSTIFKSKRGQLDIELFNKYSEHLRRLLQILYYQPAFVLNSIAKKTKDTENYPIYYSQSRTKNFNNYKLHVGYLSHYRDLVNFPEIIKKWFIFRESDDYTYTTWVASKHLFINTPFSEEVFLENVRVLEVYHKAKYPKPSKRQENNTHLRERIATLLDKLKGLVDQKAYDNFIINESDFIDILIANRNYLTHYGENATTSKNILTVLQLYSYAVKSRIILLSLLLHDIGIEAKQTFGNLIARH
ncbi:HEPN domain-containing protein [Spirosoma sp. 48-14]|uniref:HEPN domain-containing protein n=1 Tax=Spirosoma sp. 48-14 TaxID=1895854 RepID=UPI000968E6D3|nr:HEPN domain-containing protein [Spirosoma sp. 48-14]OJW76978.1 MAG: hypothetical protein BGO59_24150 [Spirosoma sp. 48-14]